MQTIDQLLDSLKDARNIPSDYKLALYLGVAQGSVQNWRHGRSLPDSKAVTRIAQELGLDTDVLLLQVESMRAGNEFAKAAWARIAERLQAGAAHLVMLMAVAIISIAGYAPNAGATVVSHSELPSANLYIVSSTATTIRRFLARLKDWFLGPIWVPCLA